MAVTTYANMQIVPNKFSAYTLDRTTAKSAMVQSGIAVADSIAAQLINGLPAGGRTGVRHLHTDCTAAQQ